MTPPYRLLLCTDMDRTVIPNGAQAEHPLARRSFRTFCAQDGVTLAYVTGRHRELVEAAISEFELPVPDFVITDVGTRIYRVSQGEWNELLQWKEKIGADWGGNSRQDLQMLLQDFGCLRLQDKSRQSEHKLSYHVSLSIDNDVLVAEVDQRLREHGVRACVLWSIDEPNDVGLLDVIPQHGTKLHAIEFLQETIGYSHDEVLFAGDSGNDMPVLVSGVLSILVYNASDEVKQTALKLIHDSGNTSSLYLAEPDGPLAMNGNYCAGVLQGVWHFAPAFRELLASIVADLEGQSVNNNYTEGQRHG